MKIAQTFVIFPFFTSAAFLGAIVLAPFFAFATFGRLLDLAVPAAGLDLIAPCAIGSGSSVFGRVESGSGRWGEVFVRRL